MLVSPTWKCNFPFPEITEMVDVWLWAQRYLVTTRWGFISWDLKRLPQTQKPEGVRTFMSLGLSLWGRAPCRRPSTVGISILGGAAFWGSMLSVIRVAWDFITSMGVGFWAPRYACRAKPAGRREEEKPDPQIFSSFCICYVSVVCLGLSAKQEIVGRRSCELCFIKLFNTRTQCSLT